MSPEGVMYLKDNIDAFLCYYFGIVMQTVFMETKKSRGEGEREKNTYSTAPAKAL